MPKQNTRGKVALRRSGWVARVARVGRPGWVAKGGSPRAGRQGGLLATHPEHPDKQTDKQTEKCVICTPVPNAHRSKLRHSAPPRSDMYIYIYVDNEGSEIKEQSCQMLVEKLNEIRFQGKPVNI